MDGPEVSAATVGSSRFDEAVVDAEVVPDSVPPVAVGSVLVVRIFLLDVNVNLTQDHLGVDCTEQSASDHLDVRGGWLFQGVALGDLGLLQLSCGCCCSDWSW